MRNDFEQFMGNTPTGVGKTGAFAGHTKAAEKHPHGRGEDFRPAFA